MLVVGGVGGEAEATEETAAEAIDEATEEADEPTEAATDAPIVPSGDGGTARNPSRQRINVRSGPGTGNPVVGVLEPDAEVPIIGEEDGWVNIVLPDGTEGWAFADLLEIGAEVRTPRIARAMHPAELLLGVGGPRLWMFGVLLQGDGDEDTEEATEPQEGEGEAEAGETATITSPGQVVLRAAPNLFSPGVGVAESGATVASLGPNAGGGWVQIRLDDGTEGWVLSGLVTLGEVSVAPSAQTPAEPIQLGDSREVDSVERDVPQTIPNALERWYSLRLALIVAAAVIVLGNLINIGRAIARRRSA